MSNDHCPECLLPYYDGRCLRCGRVKPLLPGWRWHDTAMVAAVFVGLITLAYYVFVD